MSNQISELNNHPDVQALPDYIGVPDCGTWVTYGPTIKKAMAVISKLLPAKVVAAINFLIKLADTVCPSSSVSSTDKDKRRAVAEAILNKAATDPTWKEKLLTDPSGTLHNDQIGKIINDLPPVEFPLDCDFSCILST